MWYWIKNLIFLWYYYKYNIHAKISMKSFNIGAKYWLSTQKNSEKEEKTVLLWFYLFFFKKMCNNLLKFFKLHVILFDILFELILILSWLYLVTFNYIDMYVFKLTFFFLQYLLLYKLLDYLFNMSSRSSHDKITSHDFSKDNRCFLLLNMDTQLNRSINPFREIIRDFISYCIENNYEYLLDVIYWVFRLIPWNLPNKFVLWIWEKGFDFGLLLNSNKDIYYKKRGLNRVEKNITLLEWKYYYLIEWFVIYPILRVCLLPQQLSKYLLKLNRVSDLFTIRLLILVYVIIYFIVYVFLKFNICIKFQKYINYKINDNIY